jgi:hypothetical protein
MSRMQETVFTLYGDYIRHRGGEAWTGSLIELSGQAVCSTLSRMSRKGWLEGRKASRFSFYSLTPRCLELRNAVWTVSLPTDERIEPNRQTTITEALVFRGGNSHLVCELGIATKHASNCNQLPQLGNSGRPNQRAIRAQLP